jgi:hypothetical protein
MNIIIKNVTGDHAGLIWELSRAGAPEGTVIRNVIASPNNAVYFTVDGNECVAWIGDTCEIQRKAKKVVINNLYKHEKQQKNRKRRGNA